MWHMWLLSILALLATGQSQTIVRQTCTADREMTVVQPGASVVIGGLFEIRAMGTSSSGCGKPLADKMQIFESARFALKVLNDFDGGNGYGGVKFGMNVYDTCYSPSRALGALQKLYPQSTASEAFCTSNSTVIAGIVGPLSSRTTIPVAAMAGQLQVSIISPAATNPELNDRFKYPTFFRTVASDTLISKVTAELMYQLQWHNILVVYTDDIYSRGAYEQMLMAAYNRGLCVSRSLLLDSKGNKDSYKSTLNTLGPMSSPAAILLAPNSLTKIILQAVDEIPALADMQWILDDIDITNDVSSLKRVRGAMIIVPRSARVPDFANYFSDFESAKASTGNPWFKDWFEETYACSISGAGPPCPTRTAAQLVQSPWAVPTMKAVFAYAEAVRTAGLQLTTMTSANFTKVLQNINFVLPASFPDGLRGQVIKFDANGNPDVSDFTVYNYNNLQQPNNFVFEEIGRYVSNVFTLDKQPILYDSTRNTALTTNPTATCAALGCENCLLPTRPVTYRYKSGDLVIASLINAHLPGRASFTCGSGRAQQLAELVAAEWAVAEYKKNNPMQLNLGSLVADICPDSLVAESFITDLLSGNNKLSDPSTGAAIPYSNIQAFVNEMSSSQTEVISPIISQYNIPEVQTSISSIISRGSGAPYFTRAVPSDNVVYSAISNLLLRLGWKYVQIVTHKSGEYNQMAKTFTRVAACYGICVVESSEYFGDGMADAYNRTVQRLLSKPSAQIVVVFASMVDLQGLLAAIGQSGSAGQLQLVAGTDDWGRNLAYIQGLESSVNGAIVFDFEMSPSTAFNDYLGRLTQADIISHPFLLELFELTNRCALDPASQDVYTRMCTNSDTFSNVYQGKVPYIIQTINTVASKLLQVIGEVCNNTNYVGLCAEFRSAPGVASRLSALLADSPKLAGFGTRSGEGITNILFHGYSQGWKQIAQFNTEGQTLDSTLTLAPLGNHQSKQSTCLGACNECQYLFTMQTSVYSPGDWLIAGAFSVSNPGPQGRQPYICGDIRTENGPQFTMAMSYALQQVNSGTAPVSVRGVKFGGLLLDHCGNPDLADLMVSDIYADFLDSMDVDQDKILAWVTDTSDTTNQTIKILDPLGVATVSPSATSASLMNYPTFFRTIQGDAALASALINIVKALKFSYIQVVYSANTYGMDGLDLLTAASQAVGICITNAIGYSATTNDIATQLLAAQTRVVILFVTPADANVIISALANNLNTASSLLILTPVPFKMAVQSFGNKFKYPIISLQLQSFNLSDYRTYINSSPYSNPFFAQYYMKVLDCNVPGYSMYPRACTTPLAPITQDPDYVEDSFILPTIDAIYSVVDALHQTIIGYCGSNYTKPCSAFMAASDKRQRFNINLNKVNFVDDGKKNFRFLAREGETFYDIMQGSSNGNYNKVGRYSGQSLEVDDATLATYMNVQSSCNPPCLGCIIKGLNFSHTAGDVYLAGVFDVHDRSLSPFTCGKIQTLHGFLLLEAFHYAINQVNSKQGQFADILRGTRLGGVGLDSCRSDVRGGYLVSNIHSGLVTLAKDGTIIFPSMIDAYIGSYSSTASVYLARILTDLEIPQISYAAGSEELSDQRVYPFFYRTVPTDDDEVEAILKLMDKLNIRYVQVLYEDNSNGLSAMKHFVERAASYRVCVAESIAYPDYGTVSSDISNTIVAELVKKPTANVIVTFLSTDYINSVLQAVKISGKAQNQFRFIGSDSWADNQDAIVNVESQAAGSITVRLDADDIEAFENYINSKSLANSKDNPWFEEYFQEILQCYISKANTMGYPNPCPSTTVSLINSRNYQQDTGIVYVINAVYAAAFAIDKTLRDLCGPDYTTVCQAYRGDPSRHARIRDNLATVSFTDPAFNNFKFVNRSGVASYRFNSIEAGLLGYTYQQIGSYNVTSDNVIIMNNYKFRNDSDCDRTDSCAECPAIRDRGSRYVFHKSSPNQNDATTIVAFFDIHKQGVDPYRCGNINVAGFQQFLTFFYTLEKVLPNNKYQILAIDTCSNSLRIDQDLYGLLRGTGLCNSVFDSTKQVSIKNIGSVITVGELNTAAAARVLESPGITYLSPNALSNWLDDKQHLVRTIAPMSAMMKRLTSLLNKLGWTYVDVVYEDSAAGEDPFHRFAYYANQAKLCRGSSLQVAAGSTDSDVQNLLAQLNGRRGSRAVILLGSYDFVKQVMAAARSMFIADRYVWVLGIEWDLTPDALKELVPTELEVQFITVKRISYMVNSFNTYVNSLSYSNIHNQNSEVSIPPEWFDEFYQEVFGCTLSQAVKPMNIGKVPCNTTMQFSNANWVQDMYTMNTVAATYAVLGGLPQCGSTCDNVREDILKNILKVQWTMNKQADFELAYKDQDPTLVMKFDQENRWWETGYIIKHLRVKKLSSGSVTVNEDLLVQGDLNITDQQISVMKTAVNISSTCTDSEAVGGCICLYDDGPGKPQALTQTGFRPTEPRNYYPYHSNGKQQYDWPIWAITVAVLTSVGLLGAVILFLILVFAYPKRGGTSILGYMVIIGIIGIYMINFAFFVHASDGSCGARRFVMGVVYMIAIAPLLIKAIDDWRFSYYGEEKQRYSGISSSFVLFMVAVAVVLIQCIIPIIWLILVHPTASEWPPYAFARHDHWWCDPPELYDTGLVQSFIFVMFIVLVTAIFSALSFDSERNNDESRWILMSCIATAGCFLVWMIVSTSAGPTFRDPAVAIGNLVNATFLLLLMPFRKSILLCRHLNEKEKEADAREVLENVNGPYDLYSNTYDNPALELYDNQFMDNSKPSDF